jgi:glycosyltransferase involved in cell wall biosynthesis
MRVTLDGTPLLGRRTGIGRYVQHLVSSLAARPDAPDLALTAFTVRGADDLAGNGLPVRRRPVPARLAHVAWSRSELPWLELLSGRCDVFHGTNFVLPPSRRAIGVVTVHDLAFLTMPETVAGPTHRLRELVPRSLRRAALTLTPSEAVRQEVLATYPLHDTEVRVTPLGVDPVWFSATPPTPELRERLRLPDRYVVFVGTLEPRKNLAALLDAHAAARLEDEPGTPDLVLVGPPGWGPEVGQRPGVHLTGFLDDADLRGVVAGSLALALPSRAEGFGLPVLEALATGSAVLASDLPVLREVGGRWARYAAASDVPAWASLLLEAGSQPDPDGETRRGRQRWARTWTWERTAAETLRAYQDALA